MFKIPIVTPLHKLIKRYLSNGEKQNLTELPSNLKNGLEGYLKQEEVVIFTLRNYRAMYIAPRWLDSNTFFNSWFIITNQRILILRNSSSLKIFRDIPFDDIHRTNYEMNRLEPRIRIISSDKEDRIDFLSDAIRHCENIEETLNRALMDARKRAETSPAGDTMFCYNCGSKIPRKSKFCSECGQELIQ